MARPRRSCAGDERLSFAEIDALSERLAGALAGRWGIAKGDRVGIAMRNCPAWILVYMAVAKAGGIATLLNGWWTARGTAPRAGADDAVAGDRRCRAGAADRRQPAMPAVW